MNAAGVLRLWTDAILADMRIPVPSSGTPSLLPQVDDTVLALGDGTYSWDVKLFGSAAASYISWDASANDLKFEDSVSIMFGTGATAGLGTAGDVEMRFDGTDFDILGASDDLVFNFGNGTNSFDVKIFGNTATSFVLWDASADQLILDQGAADTALLQFRSSDVASGMTTLPLGPDVTASTYFNIGKAAAATGGAYLTAVAESTIGEALYLETWGGAPATTDTSGSLAAINIFAGQHDGSNADADMAADSNCLAVGEIDSNGARLTRLLLKADDGELHLGNATPAALDNEDDIMAVRALQIESSGGRGIVKTDLDPPNPFYDYDTLRSLGIVGEKDETGFSLFALQPRLALHEGALWQMFNDMMGIASVLPEELRAKLPARVQDRLAAIA